MSTNDDDVGYIYIGADTEKPNMAKVGFTARDPSVRTSETTNPDYFLFRAFEVPAGKLIQYEKKIHHKLMVEGYERKRFETGSRRYSEWFCCTPHQADEVCAAFIDGEQTYLQKKAIDDERRKYEYAKQQAMKEEHEQKRRELKEFIAVELAQYENEMRSQLTKLYKIKSTRQEQHKAKVDAKVKRKEPTDSPFQIVAAVFGFYIYLGIMINDSSILKTIIMLFIGGGVLYWWKRKGGADDKPPQVNHTFEHDPILIDLITSLDDALTRIKKYKKAVDATTVGSPFPNVGDYILRVVCDGYIARANIYVYSSQVPLTSQPES